MPTLNLHPKIKAALLTAIAAGVITVANAVAGVYPNNAVVVLLVGFAPVVAGWLTSSPKPVAVVASAAGSTLHYSFPPQGTTSSSSSSGATVTLKPTPTDPPPPPIDPPAAA